MFGIYLITQQIKPLRLVLHRYRKISPLYSFAVITTIASARSVVTLFEECSSETTVDPILLKLFLPIYVLSSLVDFAGNFTTKNARKSAVNFTLPPSKNPTSIEDAGFYSAVPINIFSAF